VDIIRAFSFACILVDFNYSSPCSSITIIDMQSGMNIDSPFAILTAIVAPAVLTNACSVLSLGTANRIARVVDRTRAVTAEISHHEPGSTMYRLLSNQLDLLRVRGRLLVRALRFAYLSLGGFASSALIAVIGGALSQFQYPAALKSAAIIGLIIGVLSVSGLVVACALMVRETTIAIDNLTEEAEIYSHVMAKRPPTT
jgi:Protein of unknown function (DUF2721)